SPVRWLGEADRRSPRGRLGNGQSAQSYPRHAKPPDLSSSPFPTGQSRPGDSGFPLRDSHLADTVGGRQEAAPGRGERLWVEWHQRAPRDRGSAERDDSGARVGAGRSKGTGVSVTALRAKLGL